MGGQDLKFEHRAEAALQKMLVHYEEFGLIHRPFQVGDRTVWAAAEYHISENRRFFGMDTGRLGTSEAGEYVLFLSEENFSTGTLEKLAGLCEEAERRLVNPGPNHAYTLISGVALCAAAEKSAVAALRRYKRHRRYAHGWGVLRLAVVELDRLEIYHCKNGKEFKNVLWAALNKE